MSFIRKALQRLAKSFDMRALQHDIDTHRLFLLTEYQARLASGITMDEAQLTSISQKAEDLDIPGMRQELARHLHQQVTAISQQVDALICGKRQPRLADNKEVSAAAADKVEAAAEPKQAARPRGLWGVASQESDPGLGATPKVESEPAEHAGSSQPEEVPCRGTLLVGSGISMSALSNAFQERHGFSLMLAPSAIDHPRAGIGVWLKGKAPAGAVVGFYPGIVYTKAHYRDMPGYPKVDQQSDYLIARYDGAVLDAKPWGRGALEAATTAQALGYSGQQTVVLGELLRKERRHPLALGHYANHPPPGVRPNVQVAAYDYAMGASGSGKLLQRYIPSIMFSHGLPGQPRGAANGDRAQGLSGYILCLLLIASRDIENEEVLLNYRLSPGAERPDWYSPVDPVEDKRRWA